jgi:hypothetical protein
MVVTEGPSARNAAALNALQAILDSASTLSTLSMSEAASSTADLLETLACSIKEHGDLVSSHVPLIRNTLQTLAVDHSHRGRHIDQLAAQVKSLQQKLSKLEEAEQDRRQRVLLGQVAYRLDEVAREFVFRGTRQIALLSIGEIRKKDERNELLPEQATRWATFKRFLDAKQWNLSDIVAVAKPLRSGRFVDAHGSEEEREKVTQSQLEEWASRLLEPAQVDGVKAFISLVAEFAEAGQVLAGPCNAVSVVQACLNEQV